jgi:hypothetical protein
MNHANVGARYIQVGSAAGPTSAITAATIRNKLLTLVGQGTVGTPAEVRRSAYAQLMRHATDGRFTLDPTRQRPQPGRPGQHTDYRGPLPLCERGSGPRSPEFPSRPHQQSRQPQPERSAASTPAVKRGRSGPWAHGPEERGMPTLPRSALSGGWSSRPRWECERSGAGLPVRVAGAAPMEHRCRQGGSDGTLVPLRSWPGWGCGGLRGGWGLRGEPGARRRTWRRHDAPAIPGMVAPRSRRPGAGTTVRSVSAHDKCFSASRRDNGLSSRVSAKDRTQAGLVRA